nr:hypothetical protein [Paraburkholderia youngii]
MKKLECTPDDDFDLEDRSDVHEVRGNPEFPEITEGLEVGGLYQYDEEHWFGVAGKERELNERMDQLATLVGYDCQIARADGPGPFQEWFRYPGHMGTIGSKTSAKLAADFAAWDSRAREFGDASFHAWFALVRKMFEYAADDGAVWLRCA